MRQPSPPLARLAAGVIAHLMRCRMLPSAPVASRTYPPRPETASMSAFIEIVGNRPREGTASRNADSAWIFGSLLIRAASPEPPSCRRRPSSHLSTSAVYSEVGSTAMSLVPGEMRKVTSAPVLRRRLTCTPMPRQWDASDACFRPTNRAPHSRFGRRRSGWGRRSSCEAIDAGRQALVRSESRHQQ
jgi:hypothetical protein